MNQIEVNPIILISFEALKYSLKSPEVLRALAKVYHSTEDSNLSLLASELSLKMLEVEIPPEDFIDIRIKGGAKGKRKAKVAKKLKDISHRIDLTQNLIIQAEEKYRENLYAFPIAEGTTEYDRLIHYIKTIENLYTKFSLNMDINFIPTAEEFYTFYISQCYQRVNKNSISIQHLNAESIKKDIGAALSKWGRFISDPYKDLSLYLLKEVKDISKLYTKVDESIISQYDKARKGISILINRFFNPHNLDVVTLPEESIPEVKKYIKAWVVANYEAYTGFCEIVSSASNDINIILGFMAGTEKDNVNTALDRLEKKIRTVQSTNKEKPVPTKSKRITNTWNK